MGEPPTKLCCLIVQDLLGSFLANIFLYLIQHGRSIAQQLAQRCRLPLRQIHSGLAVLVQQRLVRYHTSNDGSVTYQADKNAAYSLIRTGKLIDLVRKRYGFAEGAVIETLARLGFASVGVLLSHLTPGDDVGKLLTNGNNGGNHFDNGPDWRQAITNLVQHRFLSVVRPEHLLSVHDLRLGLEDDFKVGGIGTTTKGRKAAAEIEAKIEEALKEKLNSSMTGADLAVLINGDRQDNQIVLCINLEPLTASVRADILGREAEKAISNNAARCLNAVLRNADIEFGPLPYKTDLHTILVKEQAVCETLRSDRDSSHRSIPTIKPPTVNGWHGGKIDPTSPERGIRTNGIRYELGADTEIVTKLLNSLAETRCNFLRSGNMPGDWIVNYELMKQSLQQDEILRLMKEQLQGPALRIIRILLEHGKLDEKSLQEKGLLGAKELRQTLAQLHQMGFAELQEVPREPQRLPNRTMFYWFFNPQRSRKVLLDRLYESISKLFERLFLEREYIAITLSKIERKDVHGNEEMLLPAGELEALKRWRRKEHWLIAEIGRLDESVILLGDF